ncbi:MAG: 3' terminal RNA ribose 2'-O-methyltransferase Hen1 [Phycisphaerae bacterium]|nr:3' terminal RNA ribose 2'-O-methyltransferase Hen1 [Phycisphaerae bacterium]
MLLTITNTTPDARDLGWLLHKHPDRVQAFDLSFGRAHVFYPEASADRCTAALLLDVDPVGLIRGKNRQGGLLDQYVNDRPFVASSFMSVAIAQVFATALAGRSKDRPELVSKPLSLEAGLSVLPSRGGESFLRRLFEPLGYDLAIERHSLDDQFPQWGDSPYHTLRLARTCPLQELLTHLYVLVPVLDNYKHYYVGQEELTKLLAKGEGWLAAHPEKELIAKRYLKYQPSLARQALAQLVEDDTTDSLTSDERPDPNQDEQVLERQLSLNDQRIGTVLAAIRASRAASVLDLGCGEGRLLRELLTVKEIDRIVGLDVSIRSLEIASERLRLDRLPDRQRGRIELMHGSLMYRDRRLEGFDAAAVIEVVEHLDPPRLAAFERVVFRHARPRTVVLTTPNREYNAMWDGLVIDPPSPDHPANTKLRHADHRFEWTRAEFRAWAEGVADRYAYAVRFLPVGPDDPALGPPTQMGVFTCE